MLSALLCRVESFSYSDLVKEASSGAEPVRGRMCQTDAATTKTAPAAAGNLMFETMKAGRCGATSGEQLCMSASGFKRKFTRNRTALCLAQFLQHFNAHGQKVIKRLDVEHIEDACG